MAQRAGHPNAAAALGTPGLTLALTVIVAGLLLAACRPAPPVSYADEINAARAAKNTFLRTGADSPIQATKRADFLPLAYFPPDPAYRVPAAFKANDNPPRVQVPTSTGQMRDMLVIGTLEFTLNGRQFSLAAFTEADSPTPNRLFVPFTDLTTGTETYAAGRYMDIDRSPTGIYVVDFNRAYQPYCYYNPTYDCPYPPPSNRLKVAIRAGERLKHPAR